MKVFSEAFDAHEAREADDAVDEEEVFPVDVDTHDAAAYHVDAMGEVVGAVDV